jgi:hypothetical protein
MPDVWEIQFGLNPSDPGDAPLDPDADGLTNLDEFGVLTDPSNPDTDGDTFSDGDEVTAGTDPNDPDSSPESGLPLETGIVSGVSNTGWTPVSRSRSYTSMVVVGSPNYNSASPPLVVRVRNAAANVFEVRVDRADGLSTAVSGVDVHYLVTDEGVYTEATDGLKMEAVKLISTVTDRKSSFVGEIRSYANSYTTPVVVGQVMSYNDSRFSVFWSRGASRRNPASPSALAVGKHVGEHPDTVRADETIGYIVIEAGSFLLNGQPILAGLGEDTIRGVSNAPPYSYSLTGLSLPFVAVVSQAAMDGNDGSWAMLYAPNPISSSSLNLAVDEDRFADDERNHPTEQVSYIIFGATIIDTDNDGVPDSEDSDPMNSNVCRDVDGDTCDDCSSGVDDPSNDGTDADSDGICDAGDGCPADPTKTEPGVCGCGVEDTDTDTDGAADCDDTDDDNDGVTDGADLAPLNPDLCGDIDADTCDDCSVGTDDFGPLADNDPLNDGPDSDGDGVCDAGDSSPVTLMTADFDLDEDGFGYLDDLFRGTSEPDFVDGVRTDAGGFTGGALRVEIGGINRMTIMGMSGGWQRSFTSNGSGEVMLSFRYNLIQSPHYENDELSQVLISVDGILYGESSNDYVSQIVGNGNGGPAESTGWQLFQINLGALPPGVHSLAVGGYNSRKDSKNEITEVLIDDVLIQESL